jgi:hypothetical protein
MSSDSRPQTIRPTINDAAMINSALDITFQRRNTIVSRPPPDAAGCFAPWSLPAQ